MSYQTNPFRLLIDGTKQAFANSQQVAIMLIVVPFVISAANGIIQVFIEVFNALTDSDKDAPTNLPLLIIGLVLLILAIGLQVFMSVYSMSLRGFSSYKIMRGEDANISTIISQPLTNFWKTFSVMFMIAIYSMPFILMLLLLVSGNVVVGVMATGWLYLTVPLSSALAIFILVLIVRINLRYSLGFMALYDGASNATEAMTRSRELTKGRLSEVFGINSIASWVPFLSGVVVSGGEALLYHQLKEAHAHHHKLPKQSFLNFVGLIAGLALMLLIGSFVAFIFLAASTSN